MKDKASEDKVECLHPKARQVFRSFIDECETTLNTTFRITQGLRTFAEQDKIYAQGRSAPGAIVSYAKSGKSWHNYGLAIDIAELKNGKLNWNFKYELLEPISQKYNLVWGGRFMVKGKPFHDRPHYQLTFGYTISKLYEKYIAQDFIAGTIYINI